MADCVIPPYKEPWDLCVVTFNPYFLVVVVKQQILSAFLQETKSVLVFLPEIYVFACTSYIIHMLLKSCDRK